MTSNQSVETFPTEKPGSFVPFPPDLISVIIVKRINRFVIQARLEGTNDSSVMLHMPNSGRMRELLTPGAKGMASLSNEPARKTAGTLLLVKHKGLWVSVDARMPNRLLEQCVASDYLPPLQRP